MKTIIFRKTDENLYIVDKDKRIPFEKVFSDRGINTVIDMLHSFTVEPPFELPEWMLNTIHHNNVIYALIARLKKLKDCDVSQAVAELEDLINDETVIYQYDTNILHT